MKKFFFLLVLAVVFLGSFYAFALWSGPEFSAIELTGLVVVGASGLLALIGVFASMVDAVAQFNHWCRWKSWHPRRNNGNGKSVRQLGITTALL